MTSVRLRLHPLPHVALHAVPSTQALEQVDGTGGLSVRTPPHQPLVIIGQSSPSPFRVMIDFIEKAYERIGGFAYLKEQGCGPVALVHQAFECEVLLAQIENVLGGFVAVHARECGAGAGGGQS